MAVRRKPQVKKIKFELTRSSIAGIGVVCFCIFIWMFLLGVWTGQSLLLPKAEVENRVAQSNGVVASPEQEKVFIGIGSRKKIIKD